VEWMHTYVDKDEGRSLWPHVMNFRTPQKGGLTSWVTTNFLKRKLL
jgi:hypothetical protein